MLSSFKIMLGTVLEVIDINEQYATEIKVYISELLPMNTNSNTEPAEYKFSLKNDKDEKEEIIVNNKGYITCQYFNQISNRPHPPVVHPTERVYVFQIGDPDIYYWLPTNLDHKARSTEHIKIVIADRPKDQVDTELSDENTWFMEIDTRNKKLIHLHTSISDEEAVGYDIKINPTKETIEITDTKNNMLIWESKTPRIYIKNNKGSIVDVNKEDIIIDAPRDIWIKSGRQMVVDTPILTTKAPTTKFEAKKFGIEASTMFSAVSALFGVDGLITASGPIMTAGLFMGQGITPGAGPTLPPVVTVPGSSPDDSVAGGDTTAEPSAPNLPTLATRFAADWQNMKAAIDMIAIYCGGITKDPVPFTGVSVVQTLTTTGKLPHVTDILGA